MVKMDYLQVMTKEALKSRKTSEPIQESDKNDVVFCELEFSETVLGCMVKDMMTHIVSLKVI